jgi:hypothetical protein
MYLTLFLGVPKGEGFRPVSTRVSTVTVTVSFLFLFFSLSVWVKEVSILAMELCDEEISSVHLVRHFYELTSITSLLSFTHI